jgi:FkbM family methyltransferase
MSLAFTTKHAVKAAFRSLGLDVRRRQPHPLQFLVSHDIRTVLDVGAHDGEFADDVRAVLPMAMLHSFEPLPGPFHQLQRRHRGDPRFRAWNVAIGDKDGRVPIHVGSNPATSSLLPAGCLKEHFPNLDIVEQQMVTVTTLDAWSEHVALEGPLLLKADVQGFEGHVLRGARRLLERSPVLLLEVSFERLYAGQPLFEEIAAWLAPRGFRLHGMIDPISDRRTCRQLQSNAVFCRDQSDVVEKAQQVGNTQWTCSSVCSS